MYNKQDAVMTRGFAIMCMLVLHLFCRTGTDVFGTPLIWLDHETPFVYLFGFYSEICVSIYSICMGYAQYHLYLNKKADAISVWKRILKLMLNYWIILVIFSILGLMYPSQKLIPGTLTDFIKSIILLHSYNGAWWFLNTYIIFLLTPVSIKFYPVKKLSAKVGLILCFIFQTGWFLFNKLGYWPVFKENEHVLAFVMKEVHNLLDVLPSALAGGYLCKSDAVTKINNYIVGFFTNKTVRKTALCCMWIMIFVVMNLIHKAVLTFIFAIVSFLLFNIWDKSKLSRKVWLFLGKHSTNIWLCHMFFYSTLFTGLIQTFRYPLVMLGLLLVLCVSVSYIEILLERFINKLFVLINPCKAGEAKKE